MITSVLLIFTGLILSKNKSEQFVLLKKIKNNIKESGLSYLRLLQILAVALFLVLINSQTSKAQNCTGINPDFSYTLVQAGCQSPDTLTLTNNTTGAFSATANYFWKNGNTIFDTTSGLSNPSGIVLSSGTHQVSLIAQNGNCYDTLTKIITVYTSPNTDFNIFEDTICLGSPVLFTNRSTQNSNWSFTWAFGDGNQSMNRDTVSHVYKSAGTYAVTLTLNTNNGCHYQVTKNVIVQSGGQAIRFYDNLGNPLTSLTWSRCLTLITDPDSFTQTFASADTLTNYVIDFGDGSSVSGSTLLPYPHSTISHRYNTLGVFDFVVTSNSGGCTKVFTGKVINLRVPTVGIGGPHHGNQNGCIPFKVGFKNTSTNISHDTRFIWDFGDSKTASFDTSNVNDSVYHNYMTSACNVYINLTATNMCGSTQASWGPVNAYSSDRASIGPDSIALCHPNYTASFSNYSNYNCYGGEKLFFWDFGDSTNTGWTNVGSGRTHTYDEPGVYEVTFVISNLCGTDTSISKVVAFPAVEAKFSFTKSNVSCVNATYDFIDSSKGSNLTYLWDFGDGTTSTQQAPSHTFTDTGVFNVTLIVTGSCGKDTTSKVIEIYKKPVASFTNVKDGCAPYDISPFNNSRDLSPYANYTWSVGRWNPITTFHPGTLSYPVTGTYTLQLIINDVCGNDTFAKTFSVFGKPVADFSTDNVCQGDTTTLVSMTAVPANQGVIVKHLWDLGNGYSQNIYTVKKVFSHTGNINVGLIVESSKGCIDTIRKDIQVKDRPAISLNNLSGSMVCDGNPVQFNASASVNNASIDSFNWIFSDGQQDTGRSVSHIYHATGYQGVILTVKANNGCSNSAPGNVTILNRPNAGFSVESVCFGEVSRFLDATTIYNNDQITKWYWDFDGDGVTDDSNSNASYLYTVSGPQQVRLMVKSGYGCYDTVLNITYVHNNPDAWISLNNSSVCQNTDIVVSNNTTIGDTFFWNYGDGSGEIVKNDKSQVIHSYTNPGSYYIRLVAKNIYNCEDKDSIQVTVNSKPVAIFSNGDTIGCAPFTTGFTNLSMFADSFRWYKDGIFQTSNNALPQLTLTASGDTADISLIAYNNKNCPEDTFTRQFVTVYNPVPSFVMDKDRGCSPFNVSFTNNSRNALFYNWDFGNGDTSSVENPVYTYYNDLDRDTFFIITLKSFSSQNCVDSISDTVFVYGKPKADFVTSVSEGCGPLQVQFTNTSHFNNLTSNLNYTWDLGNGASSFIADPSSVYNYSNSRDTMYDVKLSVLNNYGCHDSIIKSVKVFPKPVVDFTAPSYAGCGPHDMLFFNTSVPIDTGNIDMMSFAWDLGNGNMAVSENTSTTYLSSLTKDTVYQVKLIGYSEHNCVDSVMKTVRVYPRPLVSFTKNISSGCGPLNVQFTNNSNPGDTGNISIMNFNWDFDNGQTAVSVDASQSFIADSFNDQVYNVKLIGYSEHNCIDSAISKVRVFPKPTVEFAVNEQNGCGPHQVVFNNQSVPNDTGSIRIMDFSWDFGNGIISYARDTTMVFQAASRYNKTYQVQLTGYSEHNCVSTTSKNITVYPLPDVTFNMNLNDGCGPLSVSFMNTSDTKDSSSVSQMSFNWDFGNGNTGNIQSPSQTFYASNLQDTVYQVILTGYSQYQCVDYDTQTVRVYPSPKVDFSIDNTYGCHPLQAGFTNLSHPKDTGSINDMTFLWNLGNGQHSQQLNPQSIFTNTNNQPTFYTITLTGTSEHGCNLSTSRHVVVNPSPEVSFTQTEQSMCDAGMVDFTNTSISRDQNGVNQMSFTWNFGNSVFNVVDTNLYFDNANLNSANYEVSLFGTNQYGCQDSFISFVNVFSKPEADFNIINQNHCGDGVIFRNTTISNDSQGVFNSNWDFGGLYNSNKMHDTIDLIPSYYQDTTYSIRLSVQNSYGCRDTNTKTYTIHPKPNINFKMSSEQICSGNSVDFTNQSSNADSFVWDFGDNNQAFTRNPVHLYRNLQNFTKVFNVKLQGFNEYGCPGDTMTKNIIVHPEQSASIITNADSGCSPLSLNLFNNSQNSTSFKWFINGDLHSAKTNTSIVLEGGENADSIYEVTLISSNSIGCSDTAINHVKVFRKIKADFEASAISGCNPLKVSFDNRSKGAKNYFWDFENGNSGSDVSPTTTFNNFLLSDLSYQVTLFAVSDRNCFDSAKKTITVHPNPVSMFTTDRNEGCAPLNVTFNNISLLADSFIWDFSNGQQSRTKDEMVLFDAPDHDSTYKVKLTAFSIHGCEDVFELPVKVYTQAKADFTHVDSGCSPLTTHFQDNSEHATSWFWDFGDGQFSTEKNPEHIYTESGDFNVKLRVTNPAGCADEKMMNSSVVVYEKPKADFYADRYVTNMDNPVIYLTSRSDTNLNHNWKVEDNGGLVNGNLKPKASVQFFSEGKYNVILTVGNDYCSDQMSRQIEVKPPVPTPGFTIDRNKGCVPLTVQFTDDSKYSEQYTWYFGDGDSSIGKNPVHIYQSPGTYSVTQIVQNNEGMNVIYKEDIIVVRPKPNADFEVSPSIAYLPNAKVSMINLSVNAEHYEWDVTGQPGDTIPDPIYVFNDPGFFSVQLIATSKYGCKDTTLKENIIRIDTQSTIYLPNAFSPNDDHINDVFKPKGTGISHGEYSMQVYNRWGQVMYETQKFDSGWDGRYNNKLCEAGTYYYSIVMKLSSDEKRTYNGEIVLIR